MPFYFGMLFFLLPLVFLSDVISYAWDDGEGESSFRIELWRGSGLFEEKLEADESITFQDGQPTHLFGSVSRKVMPKCKGSQGYN